MTSYLIFSCRMASNIQFDGQTVRDISMQKIGYGLTSKKRPKSLSSDTHENLFAPPKLRPPKEKIPTLFDKPMVRKKNDPRKPLPGIPSSRFYQ